MENKIVISLSKKEVDLVLACIVSSYSSCVREQEKQLDDLITLIMDQAKEAFNETK